MTQVDPRFNVVVTQRAKKEMGQAEKAQQVVPLKIWENEKKSNFLKTTHQSKIADEAEPEGKVWTCAAP